MQCPKCGFDSPQRDECPACGIIYARYHAQTARSEAVPRPDTSASQTRLESMLQERDALFIEQHARHWWEILFNWEQANQYMIRDLNRRNIGIIQEHSLGFLNALIRTFLGSHRPLDVKVVHFQSSDVMLELKRNFFFFFSDLAVVTPEGRHMGSVRRRFGFFFKRYDLLDARGNLFARIASPFWRLWTFPIFNNREEKVAVITKKWSGLLKEAYTDADNFLVDFGKTSWTLAQKAVIFAAALSIDFDFFENNHQ